MKRSVGGCASLLETLANAAGGTKCFGAERESNNVKRVVFKCDVM